MLTEHVTVFHTYILRCNVTLKTMTKVPLLNKSVNNSRIERIQFAIEAKNTAQIIIDWNNYVPIQLEQRWRTWRMHKSVNDIPSLETILVFHAKTCVSERESWIWDVVNDSRKASWTDTVGGGSDDSLVQNWCLTKEWLLRIIWYNWFEIFTHLDV